MPGKLLSVIGACSLALFFVAATPAATQKPANVAGTWQLVLAGRQDHAEMLVFTQDGEKIKGTLGPANAKGGIAITGTVDGNKIKFGLTIGKPNGPTMSQNFTGTVNGDTMSGTDEVVNKGFTGLQSFMNRTGYLPWTAKREK